MKTRKIIQKNGFTLFELLVSISIIGILTALGVVAFSSAQSKARDSRRVQDMDALQKAAEQYYGAVSPNAYPVDTTISNWTPSGGSPIFQIFPVDPKKVSPYLYNYQPVGSGYWKISMPLTPTKQLREIVQQG